MAPVYRVTVSGPLPIAGVLEQRFTDVRVASDGGHTVIECSLPDQPALRALLTLVWDLGGEVLLLCVARAFSRKKEELS